MIPLPFRMKFENDALGIYNVLPFNFMNECLDEKQYF